MKKHAENEEAAKTPPLGGDESVPEEKVAENATIPANEKAKPENDTTAKNAEKTADGGAEKEPTLADRVTELEKLNAELQDQYLRKAADFDNYRKRMIKEKQDAIDFANTNLLIDLIQILDNFDRAIAAGGAHEAGTPAAAFADGITMIRDQFGGMLESKYGLTYYPAKGAHFDPNIHEAISTLPSEAVAEPTVSEEFVKGYKLKDRVIRVAKVMVQMPAKNSTTEE